MSEEHQDFPDEVDRWRAARRRRRRRIVVVATALALAAFGGMVAAWGLVETLAGGMLIAIPLAGVMGWVVRLIVLDRRDTSTSRRCQRLRLDTSEAVSEVAA
jgi:peptidoglycan/LPS O-acetylase OafA/YrhL